ncbi:MAG: protein kinase [Polyangiaceae bacterium]
MVHRDLKLRQRLPGTSLPARSTSSSRSWDFGISKLTTEQDSTATSTGMALGSPAYMSPEQARGEGLDAAPVVWALGVVLYEMP